MRKKRSLLFSQKSFIIDVWLGSKYVSEGYQSILEECGVQKCKLWSVTKAIFIVLIGKIRAIFSFTLAPSTAWKVSVFGIILVYIFRHSDRNQSECWKMQTRITLNTDTFYLVISFTFLLLPLTLFFLVF